MRTALPNCGQDIRKNVFPGAFSSKRQLFLVLLAGIAYYAGSLISFAILVPHSTISIIWVPNSILLAAFLLLPGRYWGVLCVAVFPLHYIAQFQADVTVFIILWTYLLNCALAFLAVAATKKITGPNFTFGNLRHAFSYLLIAGLFAPALTSFIGAGFLLLFGGNGYDWLLFEQVFLSNSTGFLSIAPAIVILVNEGPDLLKKSIRGQNTEMAFLTWCLFASFFLAHLIRNAVIGNLPLSVFIYLPVLLWAALRFRANVSMSFVMLAALFSVWDLGHQTDIFTRESAAYSIVYFQLCLFFISGGILLLSARNRFGPGEASLKDELGNSILKALPDPVFLIHEDGTFLDYQARDKSELLVPPEVFLGKNMREIMPPDISSRVFECFQAAKETDTPQCLEYSLEMNGAENLYECRIVRSGEDKFLSIVRNITEQRLAEKALRQSEQFNRRIIESSSDCIKILDLEGNLLYINQRGRELLEMEDDSCLGGLWLEFWNELDREALQIELEKAKAGSTGRFQGSNPTARGAMKWWDVLISPITGADGGIERLLIISRDITDQKLATEKLRKNEERFNSFMDHSPFGAWITDENGYLLYFNSTCRKGVKLPPGEEAIGQSLYDIFPEKLARHYCAAIKTAAETGQPIEGLEKLMRPDGTTGSYMVYRFPIASQESGPRLVGGFGVDITEQKSVEKALSESEQKYRRIVNTMLEGIWVVDTEARITLINLQLAEMLDYEVEELIGRYAYDFFAGGAQNSVSQIRDRRRKGISEYYDTKLRRKDGSYLWALISATPIYDEKGEYAGSMALLTDITTRKNAERQLQKLTARILSLQDEERRRLARELHDETAQNLAALSINLSAIKKMLSPAEEKAQDVLSQSELLVESSLREVRTLSYLLHPPMLDDSGLIPSLQWFIQGFSARSGIAVDFAQNEEIGRLPAEIETALYRVVQEGLNNINRHSGSPTARITITKETDRIILEIKDAGRGLPSDLSDEAGDKLRFSGVGISGMRERLRLLGGQLEIGSSNSGTTLTGIVPLGE